MKFNPSVIGILRGIDSNFFGELMQASFNGGLHALEVTINTPGAQRIVAAHRHLVPENKFLGMGTVRNVEEARMAQDAGAMFFVTPNLDAQVIEFAVKHEIPIVVGGLTPTEVIHRLAGRGRHGKGFSLRRHGWSALYPAIAGTF
jgi:2-dehydro-3-deoxyphosphogluconate aldolase/(4S)-4-hydroxy-2-oxoglutarate aldolase